MNPYQLIQTHGDPLGALQKFVHSLWMQTEFDALIISPNGSGYVLESPDQLKHVNPFLPKMKTNTAQLVVKTSRERNGQLLGALLRPCEMRALNEMTARGAVKKDNLLTICVDCLGTFPTEEFEWRAERSKKGLAKESLQFAPQGGISAYRFRPACQMCAEPGAIDGDVNIGVFGLPVRQSLLVNVLNENVDCESFVDDMPNDGLAVKRDQMLAKISERHVRTRDRILNGLDENLPADIQELLEQFEACDNCQACMLVCPICTIDQPRKGKDGKLLREDVTNWLLSCAGCGMCEQSCSQHQPLSAIFSYIREQIDTELTL